MIKSNSFDQSDIKIYLKQFEKSLKNKEAIDINEIVENFSNSKDSLQMLLQMCRKYSNKEVESQIESLLLFDLKYKILIDIEKNNPNRALMHYYDYIKEAKNPNTAIFESLIYSFTRDYPPIYIISLLLKSFNQIAPEIFLPYFKELFVDKSKIGKSINIIETILSKCQDVNKNKNIDLLTVLLDIYSYNHNFELSLKIFQLIPSHMLSENHYFALIKSNNSEGNDLIINHYTELYLKMPNANRTSIFELYLEGLANMGSYIKIEETLLEYSKNEIPITNELNLRLLKAYTIGNNGEKAANLCVKLLNESRVSTRCLSTILYSYATFGKFEAVEEILEINKDVEMSWNYTIFHKILASTILNDEFDYFENFYNYMKVKKIRIELDKIIELLRNCKKIERYDKLQGLIDLFSKDFPDLKKDFQIKKFLYDISQNI